MTDDIDGQHRDAAHGITPDMRNAMDLIYRAMEPLSHRERREFIRKLQAMTKPEVEQLVEDINGDIAAIRERRGL